MGGGMGDFGDDLHLMGSEVCVFGSLSIRFGLG